MDYDPSLSYAQPRENLLILYEKLNIQCEIDLLMIDYLYYVAESK